jgi:DNA-binding beta-propeller fold protein YncE
VLSIVDTRQGRLLGTVKLMGQPQTVVVDKRNGTVFVASLGLAPQVGTVQLVDARSRRLFRTIPVGALHAIATDERRNHVFVAADGPAGGTVDMLDTASGEVLRTVSMGGTPTAMLVDDQADRVAVVTSGPGGNDTGAGAGAVASSDGAAGATASPPSAMISVLSASSGRLLCTVPAAGLPVGMVIDARSHRLFVLNHASSSPQPDPLGWLPAPLRALLPTRRAAASSNSTVSVIDLSACS